MVPESVRLPFHVVYFGVRALQAALAVGGNALTVTAIWRFPTLHSPTNAFVLNLALCDLLVGLLGTPVSIATHYSRRTMVTHDNEAVSTTTHLNEAVSTATPDNGYTEVVTVVRGVLGNQTTLNMADPTLDASLTGLTSTASGITATPYAMSLGLNTTFTDTVTSASSGTLTTPEVSSTSGPDEPAQELRPGWRTLCLCKESATLYLLSMGQLAILGLTVDRFVYIKKPFQVRVTVDASRVASSDQFQLRLLAVQPTHVTKPARKGTHVAPTTQPALIRSDAKRTHCEPHLFSI